MDKELITLEWVESHNKVDFSCKLQIAKHQGDDKNIFLIIPGVDGSIDGYEDKYLRIAKSVNQKHGHTSYQIDNPYISSLHWESNVRQILDYILMNHPEIESINIMAHSAGAWVIGRIAWEYPEIRRLLLVNPATNVNIDDLSFGLSKSSDKKIVVLIGSEDPSHQYRSKLKTKNTIIEIVDGADHNFSGDALSVFLEAPVRYLF